MPRLFVDMDGVMADFDRHYHRTFGVAIPKRSVFDKDGHNVDWSAIQRHGSFYRGIPPMQDFRELWEFIKPHKPVVITGVPNSVPEASDNKVDWVQENCHPMPSVICCASKNKWHYAEPGDTIVDDWEKYKSDWEKVGGIWVTHISAAQSIARLKDLGWT